MGYYSNFELFVDSEKNGWFNEEVFRFCRDRGEFAHFDESTKWYTFKEDMIDFSKIYRDNLFSILRAGEDYWDIEKVYFKNGKYLVRKAEIVFETFDEDKMEQLEAND